MGRNSKQNAEFFANIMTSPPTHPPYRANLSRRPLARLLTENWPRLWSSLIVDQLIKSGLNQFYLSPGMRNAPLIAAVVSHPDSCYQTGIDERAQAFCALGHAKATGRSAVLICTSGSALAHYMPALIEANKTQTPLCIISADRPDEMVFSDANQCIGQKKFYGEHIQHFLGLGVPSPDISVNALAVAICHLANKTKGPSPQSIHLNCPFRDPLDKTQDHELQEYKMYLQEAKQLFQSTGQKTLYLQNEKKMAPQGAMACMEMVKKAKNPLIVVGNLPSHEKNYALKQLIQDTHWPVFLDIASSLKLSFCARATTVPSFDHWEVYQYYLKNPPDLIVHFGGRLVSKNYYQFLAQAPTINLITINQNEQLEDPSHATNMRIESAPNELAMFFNQEENRSHFKNMPTHYKNDLWQSFILKKQKLITKTSGLTYPTLSKATIELIENNSTLYLGNSTTIRSFDAYGSATLQKNIKTACNRGASGIDGLLASAIGYRRGDNSPLPITLVVGDIAFLHDLNSLHLLKSQQRPLIIILANNQGGGIFTLLPVNKDRELIEHLTTPHTLMFNHIALQFDIPYAQTHTGKEFETHYLRAQKNKSTCIIEVIIDNDKNINLYQKLKTVKL